VQEKKGNVGVFFDGIWICCEEVIDECGARCV
jgi:hypothetical protein